MSDHTEGTRVRLTPAEQRDIKDTRAKIIKNFERAREKGKELNLALMGRIRKNHPEADHKFIKPEGEWLLIFEPAPPVPALFGANGRQIPPSELAG